jgi:hypothetical protein
MASFVWQGQASEHCTFRRLHRTLPAIRCVGTCRYGQLPRTSLSIINQGRENLSVLGQQDIYIHARKSQVQLLMKSLDFCNPPHPSGRSMALGFAKETRLWASTVCNGDSFSFCYVEDVRTSQETHLWASTVCNGDSFSFCYVEDVRTSHETHLWASTACYRNSFTFLYVDDVRTSQETHQSASTACYRDSFTFFYGDDARTSQETNLWASRSVNGDSFNLYI